MRHPTSPGRLWAALSLAFLLVSCGGGSSPAGASAGGGQPPTATIDADTGPIARDQAIVVHFSETIDIASLTLGGEIGAAAATEWSQASAANDTLTLRPRGGTWPVGEGRQLTVDARNLAGLALARVGTTYIVPVRFAAFPPAETVIGQPDFQANQGNRGGTVDANTLYGPEGSVAVSPDGKLFVPDYYNQRVLVFSAIPSTVDASAMFALGQPDLQSDNAPIGRTGFGVIGGLSIAGGRLLVTDRDVGRVLIYNTVPQDASAMPDVVLGQPDFTSAGAACGPSRMNVPEAGILTEDGKVLVADSRNNRVLIWNAVPADPGSAPDLILGQADGLHCNSNAGGSIPSQRALSSPVGIWSDGKRVVVSDQNNNRVLIWNSFPTSNFQPADIVLGQQTFTAAAGNDDNQDGLTDVHPSPRTLRSPSSVSSNGLQLAVTDQDNHRVLVWNEFPKQSFQPADMVLGHSGFTQSTPNDLDEDGAADAAGASASTLSDPVGVLLKGDHLFVSDAGNNRILIFRAH